MFPQEIRIKITGSVQEGCPALVDVVMRRKDFTKKKSSGSFFGVKVNPKTTIAKAFIGSVCRTKTMHQLLCFKSKFLNHFAFTLERYLFLLFWVQLI